MKTTKTNVSDFNITNDENLISIRNEDHYNEEEEISLANADETKSKIHEAINLRGRNHKVFNDKNGIKKAFFYASSIHAFDNETRTFEEIDTSFTENDSHTHFISGKNNFCAFFWHFLCWEFLSQRKKTACPTFFVPGLMKISFPIFMGCHTAGIRFSIKFVYLPLKS